MLRVGKVGHWFGKYWFSIVNGLACFLMLMGHWKIGTGLYAILLYDLFGRRLWRLFITSPPVWYLRKRVLRYVVLWMQWTFGKKYYWVHRNGICKVIIIERDYEHNLWHYVERGRKGEFHKFCNGKNYVFRSLDDAMTCLIELKEQEIKNLLNCQEKRKEVTPFAEGTVAITNTTAMELFTAYYVLVTDHGSGLSEAVEALTDVWTHISSEVKQELTEWAHRFSVDERFNELVKAMEGRQQDVT